MKIFVPKPTENVELGHPANESDFETLNLLPIGAQRSARWTPVQIEIVHFEHDGSPLVPSDAPWLGSHTLILKSTAVIALRPILEANGELLPAVCSEAKLYVFNPRHVLDVLDEGASEVVRFSSGRIMWIKKYAFRSIGLDAVDCFKIPQLRVSPTFVSDRFVDVWSAASLRGIDFELVWEG